MPSPLHNLSQHHLRPISRSLGASSWKKRSFQTTYHCSVCQEGALRLVLRLVHDGPVPRKPCRQLHFVLKWLHPTVCSSLHVVYLCPPPPYLASQFAAALAGPILLLRIDTSPITVSRFTVAILAQRSHCSTVPFCRHINITVRYHFKGRRDVEILRQWFLKHISKF